MTATKEVSAKERIIRTAHELFYKDGIRATGVDRIIKEAGVTKVTFYRHFPAKNDLILAFLHYRHGLWITWFATALKEEMAQSGKLCLALPQVLSRWFLSPEFHGCAFINATSEITGVLPEALPVIREHKQDMADTIAQCLPDTPQRIQTAQKCALLVDGAIVQAQREEDREATVALLQACLADFTQ
ncbi:TetR family transcriptional regulator [Mangrovibacter phragmitis]|uniref:TetR family transcriptional regulator n=1 Tax=Mangrovibacter phragmitis TaxID=1691903 RepID=A0A1B7KZI6_9ENTR|nr:TetR/AcrR family transcriptional regulator [Mangrovibacter phragmitis]OAT75539.1 TetR family transcriptional regulator [Mangrovibacter phragmitis]